MTNPPRTRGPAHLRAGPRPSRAVSGHIGGLDGVRAFAVLAVLLFHLWPHRFPGGFLGVDVFFVISGFLITTLLLRERERSGRVDLLGFWKRRARRLLPALVTVVLASIAAARMASTDLLVGIERQTIGALTFSSNWLEVFAGSDYFDDTQPTLFVTFWSLAVEEQFYLVWPLAFLGVIALARSSANRALVALGLAAVSGVLMAVRYVPGTNPTRVYYGTDTHFFGLMIGAALAFAFAGDVGILRKGRWQQLRLWIGFAALAVLVAMIFTVDSDAAFTYRGGIGVASLLTAVVVAALPGPDSAYTKVHRWRPLAWIGERSYGIYLWHWPAILVVAALLPPVAPGSGPSWGTVLLSMGATFGLAAASYRWIEMPVRRDGFRASLAACWSSITGLRGGRPILAPGPGIAAVSAAAIVVFAGVAIGTAPDKSAAQLAVEQGQQAMAAQAAEAAQAVQPDPTGSDPVGGGGAPAEQPPQDSAAPHPESDPADDPPDETEASTETETETETDTETETETETGAEPAWPEAQPVPPGELMVGLGDSVLSGAAPAVYERFPGVLLDAVPIRQWRDAPALVQQMLDAGTMRPVVVLSFGTNAGLESEESQQSLRATLDLLGPERRVVLVNVIGVSSWVPSSNEKLVEISAEYPNTVVADWHSAVAGNPSLLHSDQTHPNMEGIDVYADVLEASLEELGPR